jgi:hypothetical protein
MRTKRLSTNSDLPAVGLVGNAVDLLDVVRVGDDLVVGNDVLQGSVSKEWLGMMWRLKGCKSRAEQSRAEQSRAEQSRVEQSRAEQSRAEQSRRHP